jgi:hypothetical protein
MNMNNTRKERSARIEKRRYYIEVQTTFAFSSDTEQLSSKC